MTPIAMDAFASEFLSLYQTSKHAHKTYLKMRQVLGILQAMPDVETTADLTTRTMAMFVEGRGPKANANTTNGMLDYIRAACTYAIEEGYLDKAPSWRRVRPRGTPTRLNRACSFDEVSRLLDYLGTRAKDWKSRRLYALTCAVVFTGMRRDEALRLQVDDVDLGSRVIRIVERDARLKTLASARDVPIPDELYHVLRGWIPYCGCPYLFPGVQKKSPWLGGGPGHKPLDQLKAAATAAGVGRVTWHGLRHTFGTNALQEFDISAWKVQLIMGHTDLRTTQRYLHLRGGRELVPAVANMSYRRPA